MKNKFIHLVLALAVLSFFSGKSYSQDSELVKLYKELPDSIFQLRNHHDTTISVFKFEIRTHFLKSNYYDVVLDEYSANVFREGEGYYDYSEFKPIPDTTDEYYYAENYESHITLKIDESLGWISYKYYYEGQKEKLDFIVVNGTDSKYLILLEQDLPGMGVPNSQKYSVCKLDKNNKVLQIKELSFPEFDWNAFYSPNDVKKIRTDLIEQSQERYQAWYEVRYQVKYIVNVDLVSNELNICLTPDLDELAWRMSEVLVFEEDNGIGQAYMDTFGKLGIDKLPEPKSLCLPIKEFINF